MNMYIISSWRDHLQGAEYGMGDGVGWLGSRQVVTLYFLSIVKFFVQAASGGGGDFPDTSRGMKIQEQPKWTVEDIN